MSVYDITITGAVAGSHPRHWTEREPGQCAWPIGDGADLHSCCGAIHTEGASYCDAHLRAAIDSRFSLIGDEVEQYANAIEAGAFGVRAQVRADNWADRAEMSGRMMVARRAQAGRRSEVARQNLARAA